MVTQLTVQQQLGLDIPADIIGLLTWFLPNSLEEFLASGLVFYRDALWDPHDTPTHIVVYCAEDDFIRAYKKYCDEHAFYFCGSKERGVTFIRHSIQWMQHADGGFICERYYPRGPPFLPDRMRGRFIVGLDIHHTQDTRLFDEEKDTFQPPKRQKISYY